MNQRGHVKEHFNLLNITIGDHSKKIVKSSKT